MKPFATITCGMFLVLLPAGSSRADVQDITIAVDGVVCPVCAHSINMGIRHLNGIKTVKVLMENRVKVDIKMQPGAWIDPTHFFQQIRQVGYRARTAEVKMQLRGIVRANDDGLVLTMSDVAATPIVFQLVPAETAGKRGEDVKRTWESLKAGSTESAVEVEGWWRAAATKSQPPTLLLTKIELLPETRKL